MHSEIETCNQYFTNHVIHLFSRLLPTPGERTGERMATSASLAGKTSVRLKHLWLECGAGSQWRTCTTTITTIVAETFRDTTNVKTLSRPLFLSHLYIFLYFKEEPHQESAWSRVHQTGLDIHKFNPRSVSFYNSFYSGERYNPSPPSPLAF